MISLSDRTASFFSGLRYKVEAQRQASRQVDLYLSTGFSAFDYINPSEPVLSRILRDLLTPEGSHGQGPAFLDEFLRVTGSPELIGAKPRGVFTEWGTVHLPRARRIDIVIQYDHHIIGIENKPWASDQEDQVSDYQRNLELASGNRYLLVYLTSDGRWPNAVHDTQRLTRLSYSCDIRAWLEECERQCKSDKFRWFLRDLSAYLRREFPDGGAE